MSKGKGSDWENYETDRCNYFNELYPNSDISHSVRIKGRYSKIDR
jgi:hypothetical protein